MFISTAFVILETQLVQSIDPPGDRSINGIYFQSIKLAHSLPSGTSYTLLAITNIFHVHCFKIPKVCPLWLSQHMPRLFVLRTSLCVCQ